MKNTRRSILLLCALLLVTLVGCQNTPAETTVPPTTVPPVEAVYAPARDALAAMENITLDVTVTTYTNINDDRYSECATQVLTYQGIGTEGFAADLDSTICYGIHDDNATAESQEEFNVPYREIYSEGMIYGLNEGGFYYCAELDAAAAAERYVPVVLLDASLYGTVTSEETDAGTKLRFTEAAEAEAWAMPQEAELTEASGAVVISAEGAITQMDYALSYTYGPAEIRLEVQSKPRTEALQVAVPENAEEYVLISDIDGVQLAFRGFNLLEQADTVTIGSVASVFSQAAGYLCNQTTQMNLYGRRNGTQAKVETSVYGMDYSTGESEEYQQEEVFAGGRLTITTNDGLPETHSGYSWVDMREYCYGFFMGQSTLLGYWADVVVTDLGSLYLLEFNMDDNFGNTVQNDICEWLWSDPAFLINMASKYETNEVNGYISIDKYTGLAVAAGYYYKGTHTIDGVQYPMTKQFDQSIEAPSRGAFHEISGKNTVEQEPDEKPTPLFYHVTGAEGQEMWLLGTIHVGDARTGYLPDEIYNAFQASDALALECNTVAFDEQVEQDEELQAEVSKAYFYSGITLESLMEQEEYEKALQVLKATGNYNMNMPHAKPYLWSSSIEQFYLRQGQLLHPNQGVENRLLGWAEVMNKPVREIESNLFQIKLLTGYSKDLQLLMLKDAVETHGRDYWTDTHALYELWCAGDEEALRKEVSSQVDTSELTEEELAEYETYKPLLEEYNKAMSYDRNEGMLEVAKEYLESGETVFYAVGLAHLLDDVNGLVDALRAAGYAVELVSYQ